MNRVASGFLLGTQALPIGASQGLRARVRGDVQFRGMGGSYVGRGLSVLSLQGVKDRNVDSFLRFGLSRRKAFDSKVYIPHLGSRF